MDRPTSLVWLRNDLRLTDNPALVEACQAGGPVLALYIHETDAGIRAPGGAARWWLHQSLNAMAISLGRLGIPLLVRAGPAQIVLEDVIAAHSVRSVYWNRRFAPGERDIDATIKEALRKRGHRVTSHQGNVLAEPWTILTGQNQPYSVFSPFWKRLRQYPIERPLPAPSPIGEAIQPDRVDSDYRTPHWARKFESIWSVGEAAAQERLQDFLDQRLDAYPIGRDFPDSDVTSRLSPHLRFGEISARQVWHATLALVAVDPERSGAAEKFLSELAWRDFSYHQLFHRDDIAKVPMQEKYARMHWRQSAPEEAAWQQGQTGIPIVDAGMRELWQTGYMHNRVRMLVASFLSKTLLIDWRRGENWFWDCLVDADAANNPASWQWVAGSGLDAAPYFRIFNPVTQGKRFDAGGDYVRRWVPELSKLPDQWVHEPASAPASVLAAADIVPGQSYPRPIVDLKAGRQRALDRQAEL